jgi:hypothetical protein
MGNPLDEVLVKISHLTDEIENCFLDSHNIEQIYKLHFARAERVSHLLK